MKDKIKKIYYSVVYFLINLKWKIIWAKQRIDLGYDDRFFSDLDYHLAKIINDVTLEISKNPMFVPKGLTSKQWSKILQKISFGFGSYIEITSGYYDKKDSEYKRLYKEYKEGMKLFAKYFSNLWN